MADTHDTKESTCCCGCGDSGDPCMDHSACGCGEEGATKGCDSSTEDCGCDSRMPAPTFSTFVLSLASSTLVNLGEVPEPSSGKQEVNLVLAKHTIDIITMLQDKIQNGLDAEESRLLEGLLYELRMKYVMKK